MNVKKKGNIGENNFANWLRDQGIKAWRDNASGGGSREKSDIGNEIGYSFEVKTVAKINLLQAWKQTLRASDKTHTTPAVIIHFNGMALDKWLVVLDNHDWLQLLMPTLNQEKVAKFKEREQEIKSHKNSMKKKEIENSGKQCILHKMKNCITCHRQVKKKVIKKDSSIEL